MKGKGLCYSYEVFGEEMETRNSLTFTFSSPLVQELSQVTFIVLRVYILLSSFFFFFFASLIQFPIASLTHIVNGGGGDKSVFVCDGSFQCPNFE